MPTVAYMMRGGREKDVSKATLRNI